MSFGFTNASLFLELLFPPLNNCCSCFQIMFHRSTKPAVDGRICGSLYVRILRVIAFMTRKYHIGVAHEQCCRHEYILFCFCALQQQSSDAQRPISLRTIVIGLPRHCVQIQNAKVVLLQNGLSRGKNEDRPKFVSRQLTCPLLNQGIFCCCFQHDFLRGVCCGELSVATLFNPWA